jgi:ferredoxin
VRLVLNRDACTGHGRCYDLAPDVFGDDEGGYSVLRIDGDIPASLEPVARAAALNCPERAIEIVEG